MNDGKRRKSPEKTDIILIEDQVILCETMAHFISQQADFNLAGYWPDAESALPVCRDIHIDVALVDYMLPGMNGIQFSELLLQHSPKTKVLIISFVSEARIIFEAFEAGVAGFIHKQASSADLIKAIQSVRQGERVLSPNLLKLFIDFSVSTMPQHIRTDLLTAEQKEILTMAGAGLSNKEISDSLKQPESFVKLRLRGAMKSLNARDRTQAVIKAISQGLIQVPQ
ncbi:MAG: response regulator [Vulcanimicrobiota bacterium]